jgi:outer membrane protein
MMRSVLLYILIFSAFPVTAQESLTLQQAIEEGLKNNYSILIQKNEGAKAANNYTLGNAGMLPRIDAILVQSNTTTDTRQEYATGDVVDRSGATSNSLAASGELSWTIFNGFTMFATYSKLKEFQKAGDVNVRLTIEDAVAQIIAAYFNVVKHQALLQVVDSSRTISGIKLHIAKTKFDIGAGSKLQYLQAQVDRNADESLYKKQLVIIAESKIRLNQLLGRKVDIDFNPVDSIAVAAAQQVDEALTSALTNNAELQLANSSLEIARLTVKEWQGQRFPALDLNAGYDYTKSSSEASLINENQTTGISYGFTVRWNLFNGFNLNRNIKNAKLDYNTAQISIREITDAVNAEVRVAAQQLQSNIEIVNLEDENAALAKENIDLALERFRVGLTDELQLKEAQQSYIEALNRQINSRYDARIAETTLRRISGSLLK